MHHTTIITFYNFQACDSHFSVENSQKLFIRQARVCHYIKQTLKLPGFVQKLKIVYMNPTI